ncbi:MAG: serine/threonine-protein kinase, partial [Gemmatimonadota bacterium]
MPISSTEPGGDDDQDVLERLTAALSPTYEVVRLVGRGGFCDVFEIYDTHLDRRLAVKVLRADLAWAPGMIPRFEREARSLAKLNHPNIPPLYFVGEHEGMVYFAMPFIEGRSLGEIVAKEGPLAADRLVALILPVLDALEYAHSHGIIHRDIKPDNIVIDHLSGRPLLLDFGLAKQMASRPGSSLPGLILGTPGYTSPEQVLGQPEVDHRSDIYGLGSTLYYALTGTAIATGETPQEIIGRQLSGDIPPPVTLNPSVPAWLSDVVVCALERQPEARFQSARAMAEALRAGVSGSGYAPARQARQIRHDDPTPAMVPVTVPDLDGTVPPWLRREEDRALRESIWTARLGWVSGTLGAIGAIGWLIFAPMVLILRNDLVLPIEIFSSDGVHQVVPPEAEVRLPVGNDAKSAIQWKVMQPASSGASEVSGLVRVEGVNPIEMVRKRIRRDVDGWVGNRRSYAPRITNATHGVLRVKIVPGSADFQLLSGDTG